MTLSDPIANMLTIIRNATMRGYHVARFPYSEFKWRICQKLVENNYLVECQRQPNSRNIEVKIRYNNKKCSIQQVKSISKPSQHIHLTVPKIKDYCHTRGLYLISTSCGLLTQREALAKHQGGKVLLFIN